MRLFIEMLRDILLGKNLVILNIFNKGVKGKDNNLKDTNRVQMGGATEKRQKKTMSILGICMARMGTLSFLTYIFNRLS